MTGAEEAAVAVAAANATVTAALIAGGAGLLGIVLGFLSSFFTNRQSAKRERQLWELNTQRETQLREQEQASARSQWMRDERYRAYTRLITANDVNTRLLGLGIGSLEEQRDGVTVWVRESEEALAAIWLLGPEPVAMKAQELHKSSVDYVAASIQARNASGEAKEAATTLSKERFVAHMAARSAFLKIAREQIDLD